MDIITPLYVLRQGLDSTTLKRLGVFVPALLTMTGRITMLGLSRWTEKSGFMKRNKGPLKGGDYSSRFSGSNRRSAASCSLMYLRTASSKVDPIVKTIFREK